MMMLETAAVTGAALAAVFIGRVLVERIVVHDYQRAVLYRRGRRRRTLGAGVYWIVRGISSARLVDVRSRLAAVAGQEILSADNVALRVSVALRYRVVRPETAIEAAESFTDALHVETQLVLRDLVAGVPVEALMERRRTLADDLRAGLEPRVAALGVELESAGIRDITFPPPLKQIFAQVVEARQAAQAALEKARGETAALRHLANAARLLQGNPALVTMKTLSAASNGRNTIVLGVASGVLPVPGAATGPEAPSAPESSGP